MSASTVCEHKGRISDEPLTTPGNSRVRRVLAAAALAGVELEYDNTFTFRSNWKTPEFLEKAPLGYLPLLEDGDFSLSESGAIAEYGEFSLIW